MKTRIDFVSNSSSCSFLIATKFDSSHTFDSFVKSVVEQSNETDNSFYDHDENKQYMVQNAECNELNLRYHLKSSELLFVGTLHIGNDEICEVVVPSDKVDLNKVYSLMNDNPSWFKDFPSACDGYVCKFYKKE